MRDTFDILNGPESAPVTGTQWLKDAGSFWNRANKASRSHLVNLLDIAACVEREGQADLRRAITQAYPGQMSDVAYASNRKVQVTTTVDSTGATIIRLPPEVLFLHSLRLPGRDRLELGRDFLWDNSQDHTVRVLRSIKLPKQLTVSLELVWWVDGTSTRFWTRAMQLDGLGPEDNAPVIEKLVKANRSSANQTTFSELLAQLVGVPIVTKASRVELVLTDKPKPVVVTDKETLVGEPGDTPTVALGSYLAPGDFVFDSLQFWDTSLSAPPNWITSLKIPARYFSPVTAKGLEFTNSNVSSQLYTVAGRTRLKFAITGQQSDIDKFWAYVDEKTTELGYGFAELASSLPLPSSGQIPSQVNPLRLLWQLRLRLGTSVSVIRREPTLRLVRRLGLARRSLPPWLTHIFHFEQPVPEPYNELC